jgi:RNA polymerase sigma-70 factor (ECF subfamily)
MSAALAEVVQFPATSPSYEEREDDELMLLARGGQRAAFSALVKRHQQRALRVAYAKVGDPSAAQDLAQNAFLRIHDALDRYQPQGKFVAYLCQVITNEARNVHRASGTKRRAHAALRAVPPVSAPPTDELVLADERRRDLHAAMAGISDKLRAVVVLRFAGDLSHQEISEALNIPVGTAKSRLFLGLKELRARMTEGRS